MIPFTSSSKIRGKRNPWCCHPGGEGVGGPGGAQEVLLAVAKAVYLGSGLHGCVQSVKMWQAALLLGLVYISYLYVA